MTAVATASRTAQPEDDGDVFLVEARAAAQRALHKQKLLKEKKAQRRVTLVNRVGATLGAIDEQKSGESMNGDVVWFPLEPPPLPVKSIAVSHRRSAPVHRDANSRCGDLTATSTHQRIVPRNTGQV